MSDSAKDHAVDRLDTIRKWTRDSIIIVGVVVILIDPPILGRFLQEAKLQLTYDEAAKSWTIKAIEENRNLATDIANLTTQAQSLQEMVKQAAATKGDAAIAGLAKEAENLVTRANAASESAAASLANQQAAPGAPEAAQTSDGWMFLGKVSGQGAESWAGRHYLRVDNPAGIAVNGRFAVDGNVLLRGGGAAPAGEASKGWHVHQKVVGAVKSGETVQIANTEVIPAIDGGWAMWAQVKRGG
jgi:hypothetical protein